VGTLSVQRMATALAALAARVSIRQLGMIYAAAAVVVSIQKYLAYSYNNYLVFTGSLWVLLRHESLYTTQRGYYEDLFKYSPTFPLTMPPFAWQPVWSGLICWNLLNALALYGAIRSLWPGEQRAIVALGLVAIDMVVSLQHSQSNALVAALVIAAFASLERERPWRAGLFVAAGFFLKGYGVAVACLALLFPARIRTMTACAVWLAALALAPLAVLSPGELVQQYRDWASVGGTFVLMRNMNVMRVAVHYFDPTLNPLVVQAVGGVLFLLPFARVASWHDPRFRLRLLCSLLIGLVIFNTSAEPPTYVIAVAGCAIWYASEPRSRVDRWLTLPLLLTIILISTDVYPRPLRAVAGPWTVKAIGCLIVWLRISWELLTGRYSTIRPRGALSASFPQSQPAEAK
jgi:hypothetical protein